MALSPSCPLCFTASGSHSVSPVTPGWGGSDLPLAVFSGCMCLQPCYSLRGGCQRRPWLAHTLSTWSLLSAPSPPTPQVPFASHACAFTCHSTNAYTAPTVCQAAAGMGVQPRPRKRSCLRGLTVGWWGVVSNTQEEYVNCSVCGAVNFTDKMKHLGWGLLGGGGWQFQRGGYKRPH